MKKNKTSGRLISVLCVFLALCAGLLSAIQTYGEVKDVQYLSDIKIFYVKSKEDHPTDVAKKECEKEGYSLYPVDLNSGTGKDRVYIGYKTTTNPDLAVTDIRLLGMDKDYYLYDYEELLKYIKDSNVGTGYTMYYAACEFIYNIFPNVRAFKIDIRILRSQRN